MIARACGVTKPKLLTTRKKKKMTRSEVNNKKEELQIAQEIKFAKILAGNNAAMRERALKRLDNWLQRRIFQSDESIEDVFLRVWKGLFYTMWMSDKPLVQENCAESMSNLMHIDDGNKSLIFFKCFLQTMAVEWFGLDNFRLDKFQMLVRRMLRQALDVLKRGEWSEELVSQFREALNGTALQVDRTGVRAFGLLAHLADIYLQELAVVADAQPRRMPPRHTLLALLQPFAQTVARLEHPQHTHHVVTHVFHHLMEQSDAGIQYKHKFQAWKQLGFPGDNINCMVAVEINAGEEEEEDEEERMSADSKDVRAGKVDVMLAQLQFDSDAVADMLERLRFKAYTNRKSRKVLARLAKQFRQLAAGHFPLRLNIGVKALKALEDPVASRAVQIADSLERLHQLEQQLFNDSKRTLQKEKKQQRQAKGNDAGDHYHSDGRVTTAALETFIAESERDLFGSREKTKRKRSSAGNGTVAAGAGNAFVRNSGVWYVDEWPAEPALVKNPFSQPKPKKLKFALDLNKSQDIREHQAQIHSSPNIPYDAARKPVKPLLKPSPYNSPINPFYKKKFRL